MKGLCVLHPGWSQWPEFLPFWNRGRTFASLQPSGPCARLHGHSKVLESGLTEKSALCMSPAGLRDCWMPSLGVPSLDPVPAQPRLPWIAGAVGFCRSALDERKMFDSSAFSHPVPPGPCPRSAAASCFPSYFPSCSQLLMYL